MPEKSLDQLRENDLVIIKRNLDHPANKKQVPADPRTGSDTQWVRKESVVEVIGGGVVLERRENPARVRVNNGLWYSLADGEQVNCSATLVEPR